MQLVYFIYIFVCEKKEEGKGKKEQTKQQACFFVKLHNNSMGFEPGIIFLLALGFLSSLLREATVAGQCMKIGRSHEIMKGTVSRAEW